MIGPRGLSAAAAAKGSSRFCSPVRPASYHPPDRTPSRFTSIASRPMGEVERQLTLGEGYDQPAFGAGRLLALVDALHDDGTLNKVQRERAQALWKGILAWEEQGALTRPFSSASR